MTRWQKAVGRAQRAVWLLRGANATSRVKLAGYLTWDLLHHTIGMPVKRFDLPLRLSGLDVTVQAFSAQLGAYADIFHRGEYERVPGFTSEPGDIVMDAGANVGFFALRHAKMVGREGRVYAFEPNPAVFRLLEANVASNHFGQVRCFNAALSDVGGDVVLSVDPRATSTAHVAGPGQSGHVVPAMTLDDFVECEGLSRIDLLKMDVEGHEPHVIRGGLRRAMGITRRVVMESHSTRDEVWSLLAPLGFEKIYDGYLPNVVYFAKS